MIIIIAFKHKIIRAFVEKHTIIVFSMQGGSTVRKQSGICLTSVYEFKEPVWDSVLGIQCTSVQSSSFHRCCFLICGAIFKSHTSEL